VVEVLRTSTQMGARVRAFEARVAELFAKRHGVMVNSGSSALQLATELLGLREGDEVVTPVLTFATTVAPLVRQRLVPSFVDVENVEHRFNVDVGGIPYDAKFVFARIGHNMEPSELGAAFGLVQLKHLQSNIEARQRNFARQLAFFEAYADVFILPRQMTD